MKETVDLESYISIIYNSEKAFLEINWRGHVNDEKMRSGYEKALTIISNNHVKNCLLDLTQRKLVLTGQKKDIVESIFTKLLDVVNDSLFVAVILPPESYFLTIEQFCHDKMVAGENHHIIILHFLRRTDAICWLETNS